MRRKLAALAAAAALLAAGGCGDDMDDLPRATLAETQAAVRDFAAGLALDPLPEPLRVGPAPCEGRYADLAGDGAFYVAGAWQVPLPSTSQRETLATVRDAARAKGYEITEYREIDEVEVVMSGRDPATGFTFSISSTDPPEAVALLVSSTCRRSPDGNYPA